MTMLDLLKRTSNALQKNGYIVEIANNKEEACDSLIRLIPSHYTVGIPGSLTIRNMDIINQLHRQGNQIFDSWEGRWSDKGMPEKDGKKSFEYTLEVMHKQKNCDVFICSTNALTADGKLINLDGNGNRVSSMIFGPKHVILVVGRNKIVQSVEEGIERCKNVAAPKRYALKPGTVKSPCVTTGYCISCQMPNKQCRVLTIIEAVPKAINSFSIILVNEELGI